MKAGSAATSSTRRIRLRHHVTLPSPLTNLPIGRLPNLTTCRRTTANGRLPQKPLRFRHIVHHRHGKRTSRFALSAVRTIAPLVPKTPVAGAYRRRHLVYIKFRNVQIPMNGSNVYRTGTRLTMTAINATPLKVVTHSTEDFGKILFLIGHSKII